MLTTCFLHQENRKASPGRLSTFKQRAYDNEHPVEGPWGKTGLSLAGKRRDNVAESAGLGRIRTAG